MRAWLVTVGVCCGCASSSPVQREPQGVTIVASDPTPSGPRPCDGHPPPKVVSLPDRPTLGDFWTALSAQVVVLDTTGLRSRFRSFTERHGMDAQAPGLWDDFVRTWIAFEATRDGGWWRVRWAITNQEPSSVRIWKSWIASPPTQSFDGVTAVAECDEITSLFAVTARQLGVRGIGLYYPTWNHTIAAWAPAQFAQQSRAPVVLVPTTQIFQGCPATFDLTTFAVPKHVYEYPRYDVRNTTVIPAALATFLLEQVRAYGEASPELLALIRAKRANALVSSVGDDCDAYRRELARELQGKLTCADRRALTHLAQVELHQATLDDAATLAWLGEP
jgi:hypothetical protein